jgi:hypothetical protein
VISGPTSQESHNQSTIHPEKKESNRTFESQSKLNSKVLEDNQTQEVVEREKESVSCTKREFYKSDLKSMPKFTNLKASMKMGTKSQGRLRNKSMNNSYNFCSERFNKTSSSFKS